MSSNVLKSTNKTIKYVDIILLLCSINTTGEIEWKRKKPRILKYRISDYFRYDLIFVTREKNGYTVECVASKLPLTGVLEKELYIYMCVSVCV